MAMPGVKPFTKLCPPFEDTHRMDLAAKRERRKNRDTAAPPPTIPSPAATVAGPACPVSALSATSVPAVYVDSMMMMMMC